MARRKKAKLDLTLFPFLSVLSGLIAVNVLFMIVTISTRVMSTEAAPPPPVETGETGDPEDDSKVVADGIDASSFDLLEQQIKLLEKGLESRRIARTDIHLKLRGLEAVIRSKEVELAQSPEMAKPKTGESIGEPTPLRIIPAKSDDGVVRKEVFIEVGVDGYILHPEKKVFPLDPAKRVKNPLLILPLLEIPNELDKVFGDMKGSKDNRYPIFLIHPNGSIAFQSVLFHLEEKHPGLRTGYEPFSREYLLDTSK